MNDTPSAVRVAAEAVKAAMSAQGFTRDGLAEASGISPATLSRRLKGRAPGFTVDELESLAEALNLNIADFLTSKNAA